MRQDAGATVTTDAVAADLRLDVDVLLDLGVPVVGLAGEAEERQAANLCLGG